jgi:type VI secretion system protein ImpB
MAESTQHKLDKVRPPRVQITYDVEIGDAIVKKELPFIVGIMADLSGKPADDPQPKTFKERRFVEIDRDNFNDIMASIEPKVKVGDAVFKFKSIEDFNPANVLRQNTDLNTLFEQRTRLADLTAKLDGNDKLIEALKALLNNTEELNKIGGDSNASK